MKSYNLVEPDVHKGHADVASRGSFAVHLSEYGIKGDVGENNEKNSSADQSCRKYGNI
jgi:hypothetical protein